MYFFVWFYVVLNIIVSIVYNGPKIMDMKNVTMKNKWIALFFIVAHDSISSIIIGLLFAMLIDLILYKKIDGSKMALLNIIQIVVILSFLQHHMCLLTIWYNQLLGLPKCTRYHLSTFVLVNFVLGKPLRGKDTDTIPYKNIDCLDNYLMWTRTSYIYLVIILTLNIIYIVQTAKLV